MIIYLNKFSNGSTFLFDKEFKEIDAYCKRVKILWFASAWDIESLKFLDRYKLKYNKINFLLENWTAEYDKQMKMLIESLPQLLRRIDECCIVCNQNRYIQGLP